MKQSLTSRVSQTLLCATALSFVALMNQVQVQAEEIIIEPPLASQEIQTNEEASNHGQEPIDSLDQASGTLDSGMNSVEVLASSIVHQEESLVAEENKGQISADLEEQAGAATVSEEGKEYASEEVSPREQRLYAAPASPEIVGRQKNHFAAKALDQTQLKLEGQETPVDISGYEVRAMEEEIKDGTHSVYVHVLGKNIQGWVDKSQLEIEKIKSQQNINYAGKLNAKYHTISTKPFGVEGFEIIRQVGDLVGREVRVTQEALTDRATWSKIFVVGSNLSGWIDTRAITPEKVINKVAINYAGTLNGRHHTINKNQPFGIRGFEIIGQVGDLQGREVRVTEEWKTDRATWAKIHVIGSNITGWIDTRAIQEEVVTQTRKVNYAGRLNGSYHTINKNQPFGVRGFEILRAVGQLNGREVRVDQEKTTKRGTWSYIYVPGTSIQGWIDRRGIAIEDYIQKPQAVDYRGLIKQAGHSLTDKPFGLYDFNILSTIGRQQLNQEVRVLGTAKTDRASWLYIELANKQRAWVDARAVEKLAESSGQAAQIYIVKPGDYLNKIAREHGISYHELKEWNHLTSDLIHPKQELIVRPAIPARPSSNQALPNHLNNSRQIQVDYEVKLKAKSGQMIGPSASQALINMQPLFGQRFSVRREIIHPSGKYLELMNHKGQIIGYAPSNQTVQVPKGTRVVYLDAGHGGRESGTANFGRLEKDMNLNITRQVANILRGQGYVVHETRTNDKEVPLRQRPIEPNQIMPDIYVSIHHNAMGGRQSGTVQGIVTLYHDPVIDEPGYRTLSHHRGTSIISEGKRLSQTIQQALIAETGARNMGIRPQNLYVTRNTDMPATLVELGFLDHWQEHQRLINPSYQAKLVRGIVRGINNYFK
ncbi:N-acetylmuramoyl-L-alanine amidase [Hutsoniella sourekii]|uniref:N-acetylmuramoyl-L-alanine amidase n=1 Tax=Hutsoniella sourekii TaxID=87650 RepID=UPI0004B2E6DD|nr:GW dipeptide domain-containing protein [Hutsoniella sourekii]